MDQAGESREVVRRTPLAAWSRGGWRFSLFPPDHPSADLEIALGVAGLLAWAGFWLLPLHHLAWFLTPCAFHQITGLPCVSCGLTRGILALAEGHPLVALRLNPLGLAVVLALLVYTPPACVLWWFRLPRPRLALTGREARRGAWCLLALVIAAHWAFLIVDGR